MTDSHGPTMRRLIRKTNGNETVRKEVYSWLASGAGGITKLTGSPAGVNP